MRLLMTVVNVNGRQGGSTGLVILRALLLLSSTHQHKAGVFYLARKRDFFEEAGAFFHLLRVFLAFRRYLAELRRIPQHRLAGHSGVGREGHRCIDILIVGVFLASLYVYGDARVHLKGLVGSRFGRAGNRICFSGACLKGYRMLEMCVHCGREQQRVGHGTKMEAFGDGEMKAHFSCIIHQDFPLLCLSERSLVQ
ncbi:hypothetical protein EJ06DRAFT_193207 [Trichodelitschia bisporula]|uniref:Uncharacterized protein n=1 Tax=Trichodelitschia bisporula TaxID=703511 RepID=A0A6G1I7H5_9PEZI|nr:hypothetical protein EJ06DRAFT_193207 [Trichodelitschia bisporula]